MIRTLTMVLALLATAGCGTKQAVECTAASATEPLIGIVKEQLEKAVVGKVRGEDGNKIVSLSKFRASIAQLVIGLEDIRTSKEDPNSTKRFCAGTLKISFAADLLADADRAREAAELNSVSDLADDADIDRQADRFSSPIEFNVQPTDDGSKVFAETETGNSMFEFAAEVLSSGLMKAAVEDGRRQAEQAAAEQTAAQDAALNEQKDANLASAKLDNQLAVQTIGATWQSLPASTRAELLPIQRAWMRKKSADCRVEAASTSTDEKEIRVAQLYCDTRATQERIRWLQQYRVEEPSEFSMDNSTDEM